MDAREQTLLELGAASEREATATGQRTQLDNTQSSEISHLNHELVNAQRELASAVEAAHRDADNLRASEIRYRRLFESAKDGILILDATTGKIEDVNPYLCQLLGYAPDDFLGKQLWEIGTFRDIAANQSAFRTLQEQEYVRYDDLPLETKDGQSVSVEFVSNVYTSGDKQVIQCNIRDISARKSAESDSVRLASIVESSTDAIISKTLDGIITTWNAGAQALYGYTAQEAIGRSVSFLAPAHLPDEMPQLLEKVAHGEPVQNYETVGLRKDGSRLDISLSISPLRNRHGHIIGASSIKRDITQSKRTESALRASEERLRAFMDNTPAVVFIKDEDGHYLYLNQAVERFIGTSAAEMLGKKDFDFLPVETARQLRANDLQVLASGQAQHFEEIVPGPDGTPRHQIVVKFPITDADGVRVLAGVCMDVTEHKQAEETLRASEARYRWLFESNPHPMWVYDVETLGFLAVNDVAIAHYGYSRDEFLGMTIKEIRPDEDIPALMDAVQAPLPPDGKQGVWRHRKKDGTIIDVELSSHELSFHERRARLALAQDITERRKAEQALKRSEQEQRKLAERLEHERARLAEAQALAKVGSWELDLVTNVQTWSDENYRIFGIDRNDFGATYEAVLELIHPDDRATVDKAHRESVANRTPYTIDHRIQMKDGSIKTLHERCRTYYDDEGRPIRSAGTTQDITERKRSEQAIEQAMQRLTEAQRIGQIGDWEWDIATQSITWSPQVFDIFGRDPRLGPPRNYEEYLTIHDVASQALLAENITRAIETGKAQEYELRARRPDGEWVDVLARAVPRKDASGNILSLYGTVQDVTERKRVEAEQARLQSQLEQQRQRLDTLVSNLPGMVWETWGAPDSARLDFMSDYMTTMLGYSVQEWVATPNFWLKIVHPDDQERAAREVAAIFASDQGGSGQYRCIAKDGHVVWAETQMSVIRDEDGRPVGLRGVSMDVTERKLAEEAQQRQQAELRVLFDLIPAMLWFKDTDNGILRINRRAAEAAGKTVEEAEGKPSVEIYPQDAAKFYVDDLAVIRSGTPKLGIVEMIHDGEGENLWMLTDKVPVCDENGKVVGIVVMSQDITEHNQDGANLQRHTEGLADLNDQGVRFSRFAVKRELRMVELKQQVNRLSQQLGTPPPYKLAFLSQAGFPEKVTRTREIDDDS